MRHAEGHLSDRSLVSIVRRIYAGRRSGELQLEGDGRRERYYFEDGELFLPGDHPLAALAASATPRQLAHRLAAVWRLWSQGNFELNEGQERRPEEWIGPLRTAQILMEEAVEGRDDFQLLRQLGGQEREFVAVSPERQAGLDLDTHEAFFLSRMEHPVSVKELLRQVELAPVEALRRLCRLEAADLIRPREEVPRLVPEAAIAHQLVARFGDRIRLELVRRPLELGIEEHRSRLKELLGRLGEMNHFELLGLGPGADAEAIHDAYMKVACLVHPAHSRRLGLAGQGGLDLLFERATEAYLTLSDPERAHAYLNRVGGTQIAEQHQPSAAERREELRHLAAEKFRLATSYAGREEYFSAVQLLEQAVDIDPQAQYYALLGECQEHNPRWLELALASYSQAVQLSRADPELRCRLAGCYEKLGRTERAKEEYEAALERMPGFPDAQAGLKRLKHPDRPEGAAGGGWLKKLLARFGGAGDGG
jgi:tetratricopeptide (TPR) repeat protein